VGSNFGKVGIEKIALRLVALLAAACSAASKARAQTSSGPADGSSLVAARCLLEIYPRVSIFGGSAWKFDSNTNQYYYHIFYPEQPDLNWRNPAVTDVMFDVTRWWYKRGVSGFRLDAVDTLLLCVDLRLSITEKRFE
jgi:Alpha amylase, catalytic domain